MRSTTQGTAFIILSVLAVVLASLWDSGRTIPHLIDSTVLIADGDEGLGTGIVQLSKGHVYIWTAAHCAESQPHVFYHGVSHDAKIVARDPQADIAVLEVEPKDFHYGVIFESSKNPPKVGTHVFHVGNFFGRYPNSLTDGIVSATSRVDPLSPSGPMLDQISAPIFPGSSGGGVFLDNGHCIGIADMQAASTCTFIIPVRVMREWATKHGLTL